MTDERIKELQDYLFGGLEACGENMKRLRDQAGYRAIAAPNDASALIDFKRQYEVNDEIRLYISVLLKNFPELDK